ncbi:MAG: Nitrate/nitrite transporter [Caulobacteraceae bacterium]|nr:Nitrate/nitrite transporter [Caulobacteraceae bacterium]
MTAIQDGPVAARAFRKAFWRIMPFLILCYMASYLDRVNVGFAKLQMLDELKFSEAVYGLGAGIFFIGYFLFEIPSNILLHKLGARVWIARILVTWGVISALFFFVHSAPVFYLLRFLLGLAEAGFFPGVIFYLTGWFPAHHRGRIVTVFMGAIPVSSIFGNPLSGWIMDAFHQVGGFSGWRWMFLIEGAPAVLLGIATLLYLDNSVRSAKWLSEEEKQAVEASLAHELAQKPTATHGLAAAFADRRIWLMCLIYFTFVLGQYGMTFWMPSLIKASGVTGNLRIGLLSAIPYLATLIAMILLGRSADRMRERRWHLVAPSLVGALGYVILATGPSTPVAIAAMALAAAGAISCAPLFWALPTSILAGAGAAAGIAAINSMGNLAGFAAPYIIGYAKDATGSPAVGLYIIAGGLVVGALCVLMTSPKLVNR